MLIGKISAGSLPWAWRTGYSVQGAQLEAEDRAAGIIAKGEYLGLPLPTLHPDGARRRPGRCI